MMQTEQLVLEYRCMPFRKIHTIAGDKAHWRRRKIIELLLQNLTQKQIASKIGWSYSTVKREIYAIRKTCKIMEQVNDIH